MGGPIVRTGTNPAFWANWDNVFGGKKKGKAAPAAEKKSAGRSAAKKAAVKSTKAKPAAKGKTVAKGKKK